MIKNEFSWLGWTTEEQLCTWGHVTDEGPQRIQVKEKPTAGFSSGRQCLGPGSWPSKAVRHKDCDQKVPWSYLGIREDQRFHLFTFSKWVFYIPVIIESSRIFQIEVFQGLHLWLNPPQKKTGNTFGMKDQGRGIKESSKRRKH